MRRNKRKRQEREPQVDEAEEVARLQELVVATAPARGTQPFTESSRVREPFASLPLSQRTIRGLADAGFKSMTEIQLAAIPHALAGRDVLGAAKTGSGKTLAFLVPLVEKLYRARITFGDGLAALVISPTRELSLQIFEVLRVFGKRHQLSAGLITGGKKEFREEQALVVRMNILVATPGRLLQHLEQTPGFDPSLVQVLVLDEADRILDLGFREQLNSILEYLPPSRQTMLFSATQTKSVKDLARLSLKKGGVEYVAVSGGKEESATPAKLVQNYVVCHLHKKMDILLGFIKTHLKSKMIVFLSSCAQVRFAYELLCALQPGTPIMALHGKCKHARRTQIYLDFVRRPGAVLLATDVAARGLDFPSVDWVIQVDAPEDAESYIHRVGRTARYNRGGRALLMLLPSEEVTMVAGLQPKNIPIKKLTINPDKVRMAGSVGKKASAFVASDPDKKRMAEKAFTSYVRAVQLMPNKQAFRLSELPLEDYALSLGLASAPRVPGLAEALEAASSSGRRPGGSAQSSASKESEDEFVDSEKQREAARAKKNTNRSLQRLKEQIKAEKERRRRERESKHGNTAGVGTVGGDEKAPRATRTVEGEDGGDDEESDSSDTDGGLVLVRKDAVDDGSAVREGSEAHDDASRLPAKRTKKMRITSEGVAAVAASKKTVFDEAGVPAELTAPLQAFAKEVTSAGRKASGTSNTRGLPEASEAYVNKVKARLQAVADEVKTRDRERVREKHLKRRLKGKEEGSDEAVAATLALSASDADDGTDDDDTDDGSIGGGDGSDGQDDLAKDDGAGGDLGHRSSALEDSSRLSDEEEVDLDDNSDASSFEESGDDTGSAPRRRRKREKTDGSNDRSLQDQEEAVLAMLANRHGGHE